jgi:phosphatidylserine/phosphatidylglycerophosphate/cardiolipin synthase-like enzyme
MSARARLVESIPLDLQDLGGSHRKAQTGEALLRLTNGAEQTIDLTAMYWTLRGDPTDLPKLSDAQLQKLGAAEGQALYDALRAAAARGVKVRILQGPGFTPGAPQESTR